MRKAARLTTPPSPAVRSLGKARGKALVVEADYFVLTSRLDPNVIFWDAKKARSHSKIPAGVTHLWISDYTLDPDREAILGEASKRGITVWECTLRELRRRLLPFWKEDVNRFMADPADPDKISFGTRVDEGEAVIALGGNEGSSFASLSPAAIDAAAETPSDLEELRLETEEESEEWREAQRVERARQKRIRLLKKAAARVKAGEHLKKKPAGSNGTRPKNGTPLPDQGAWASALKLLPELDQQIFCAVYGVGTRGAPRTEEDVAKEFAIPPANLERILFRVLDKLEPLGFARP